MDMNTAMRTVKLGECGCSQASRARTLHEAGLSIAKIRDCAVDAYGYQQAVACPHIAAEAACLAANR